PDRPRVPSPPGRPAGGPRAAPLPQPVGPRGSRHPRHPDRDREVAAQPGHGRASCCPRGPGPGRYRRSGVPGMTARDDFDRTLVSWFESEASADGAAPLLEATLDRTSRRRPRPAWLVGLRDRPAGPRVPVTGPVPKRLAYV